MINSVNITKEIWKEIHFDFEYTNKCRIEISNLGRVRSFNKMSNGRVLKGSITQGYHYVPIQFFRPREEKDQAHFDKLKAEIREIYKERKALMYDPQNAEIAKEMTGEIVRLENILSKKLKQNLKKRTIYHHIIVHRVVAKYFLPAPKPDETIVAHLDYNKLNNHFSNLKWMTVKENIQHQIKMEGNRKTCRRRNKNKGLKLTSTQVMLIKTQLKRKRPVKQIARQFSISEMQVWRIKSNENWAHVKIHD